MILLWGRPQTYDLKPVITQECSGFQKPAFPSIADVHIRFWMWLCGYGATVVSDRVTDRVTDRMSDGVSDRISDGMSDRESDRVSDRISEG